MASWWVISPHVRVLSVDPWIQRSLLLPCMFFLLYTCTDVKGCNHSELDHTHQSRTHDSSQWSVFPAECRWLNGAELRNPDSAVLWHHQSVVLVERDQWNWGVFSDCSLGTECRERHRAQGDAASAQEELWMRQFEHGERHFTPLCDRGLHLCDFCNQHHFVSHILLTTQFSALCILCATCGNDLTPLAGIHADDHPGIEEQSRCSFDLS